MTLRMNRTALALALALAVSASAALVGAQTPGQAAASAIRVGPNVLVSAAHPADTHYEVVVSAHPSDPSRLIAGSLIYPDSGGGAGTVLYASADGGLTWRPTLDLPILARTGDPATAFGPDGSAYYAASLIPAAGDRRLLLFRSPDGGSRWDGPFLLTYMDREYVTVDASAGPSRGRVYVNGNNRVPRTISDFTLFRSADGGRSFDGPVLRSEQRTVVATVMGNAVVSSDGTVVGVYVEDPSSAAMHQGSSLHAIWSKDGGESLTGGAKIDDYVAGGERKGAIAGNANGEPALAIDGTTGRFKDRLSVVWPDRRSGHSEIRFASSSDAGRTWSAPRVISDTPRGGMTDQFMPEIAVNPDGVVGVTWYDRREHPDNLGWDVRFAASFDGGASFGPSVKVSERGASFPAGTSRELPPRPSRPTEREQINAGRDSFRFMGGDTAGLAADAAGLFHAVWVDNHTGAPQVWTATVSTGALRKTR